MRRWIKWVGIACLIPLVLVLLLALLIYLPPVQNYLIKQGTCYASEATGMQIGIQRIRLSFPLDLAIQGVDVCPAPQDTLLSLEQLTIHINPFRIRDHIVGVQALSLEKAQIHTGTFIKGIELNGYIGELTAKADQINLTEETALLNNAMLSNASIHLRIDTLSQEEDTTSTPVKWILSARKVALKNVHFAMEMAGDSLRLATSISHAIATDGVVDLGISQYTVNRFDLSASSFNYDSNGALPEPGLDFNHIGLLNLRTTIDSIRYHGKEMQANIMSFSVSERSGLSITSLTGIIKSDDEQLTTPGLTLKTPSSDIRLFATVPWSALEDQSKGNMRAMLTGSVGKADILTFAGDLSDDFKKAYPNIPLSLTAGLEGNLENLRIHQLKAELPGAFTASLSGKVGILTDNVRRSATLQLNAQSEDLRFLTTLLPPTQRDAFTLPSGITLTGDAGLQQQEYQAQLVMTEDKARIVVDGRFNPVAESYKATLQVDSLEPIHFMPKDSLLWLTATMAAEGKGFDVFKASTYSTIQGAITDIRYGKTTVANATLNASLKEHKANVELKSDYPLARMDITFDGTLTEELVSGMLIADVDTIDLYGLHLTEDPFSTSFQFFADGKSNLKETHQLDLSLGNWMIATEGQTFHPKLLVLKARTDTVSTQASLSAGDLTIQLRGNDQPERLLDQIYLVTDSIEQQLAVDSVINMTRLQPLLPDISLNIKAGKDNPVYNMLREYYLGFNSFFLDAYTSPEKGVRMDAEVFAAHRDTFLIDTIRAAIRPDSLGLLYSASVIKNRYRQQSPFAAHLKGSLKNGYADAELTYLNHQKEVGLHLGIQAFKEPEGVLFKLFPDNLILGFTSYTLNPDNYVHYHGLKDIDANVRLEGKENASLWLHTLHNEGTAPELHLEISQINLANISKGFLTLPPMQGILSADIQYVPSDETFMVAADANIDNLIYQNGRVGEIMLNAVYLPLSDTEHQADVHLYRDREEVMTATALYRTGKQDHVTGSLDVTTLPLLALTPFIPDGMAQLNGALNGRMEIEGSTESPRLNGYMQLDTGSVYVSALTSRFQFDTKKIEVKDSKLSFNKYNLYASGKNPFIIDGTIDFSDFSRMTADLRMNANNMQVLDAKRSKESMVFGKLFVNLSSTIKGQLDALSIRGDLQLLGGTDVTYIMTESSLTVQDRLKDLVTFTSFTDTLTRMRRQQPALLLGGVDMMMVIHIDPVVQLRADITPDASNYVELEGGGDLSFQYTRQGDMILNGRYTLNGGNIKYALPIIPLKEFHIKQDSYVQWDGDPMNPLLNLAATERTRASVSNLGGSPQSVNFDVGILLTDRLKDMALQFTIDAPENISVKNDLASVGVEERSKRAIAMIMTGMYLDGNSASGANNMNMGNALNSFLESEINHIAGDALKTVDISVGMDTYDNDPTAGGGQRTDYSFSFAKRFYNDRIRVVIGGKVSSGNVQQQESFIDNFSFEYRLDQAGTRYVKLFHDRDDQTLLESDVMETGVGIVLRKKMLHLRELFNFRKKKIAPIVEEVPQETKQEQHEVPTAK